VSSARQRIASSREVDRSRQVQRASIWVSLGNSAEVW
jgi:hypothetical protein